MLNIRVGGKGKSYSVVVHLWKLKKAAICFPLQLYKEKKLAL